MPRESKAIPTLKNSAQLFAALGEETRLRIVSRLCAGGMSIAGLAAGSKITRQAITKHLRVLNDARIVHSKRQGRERIWQLDRQRIEDARHYLDLFSKQWEGALSRLREFVEK